MHDAFRRSYQTASEDPLQYKRVAEAAHRSAKAHCSQGVALVKLREFFASDLEAEERIGWLSGSYIDFTLVRWKKHLRYTLTLFAVHTYRSLRSWARGILRRRLRNLPGVKRWLRKLLGMPSQPTTGLGS